MGDIFEAIGFKLQDEDSYQKLAETARKLGTLSIISRRNAIIHGYRWSLMEGVEVWTTLHESKDGVYFADCRPAFRSNQTYQITAWEIIEFIEDGEALVSGRIQHLDLIFELQNFTDLDEHAYHQPTLTAHLSGLCYQAKILDSNPVPQITSLCPPETSRTSTKYSENDYLVNGKLRSWREMINPITQVAVLWLELEVGEFLLELLINREQFIGTPSNDKWISVEAWIQGHIICFQEQQLKYEGLDISIPLANHWLRLKREN